MFYNILVSNCESAGSRKKCNTCLGLEVARFQLEVLHFHRESTLSARVGCLLRDRYREFAIGAGL